MWKKILLIFSILLTTSISNAQSRTSCSEEASVTAVDHNYPRNGWNYDRERVANTYAIYAAASYDAYEPAMPARANRPFLIADNDPGLAILKGKAGSTGWQRFGARVSHKNGLSFDVYHKGDASRLTVLVAFRGTDGWLNVDLLANLSWFFQWVNPYDQYRDARNEFPKVVEAAKQVANGRAISFITTGHSLGGGLAQHIAVTFPCVSTISFNPSFVTNELIYGKFTPPVRIRVYEDKDIFSLIKGSQENNAANAIYKLNGAAGNEIVAQHSMEQLAAAMMRTALDCTKRGNRECDILKNGVEESRTLYCKRYRSLRDLPTDPVCVNAAPALGIRELNRKVEQD